MPTALEAALTGAPEAPAEQPSPVAESEQPTPEPTPEATAPGTDASEQAETPAEGDGEPAASPEPTRRERLRALLDEADPDDLDDLARHDKVAGKIGAKADKLAAERAEKLATERANAILAEREAAAKAEAEKAEAERLRMLRDSDPYAYAEETRQKEAQEAQRAAEEAARVERDRETQERAQLVGQTVVASFDATLQPIIEATFPATVIERFRGKKYEGTYGAGMAAHVQDLVTASKDEWRKEWERDALPILREQVLSETVGAEESPALGAGRPAPTGATYGSFEAISQALMDGKVTVDQVRRWQEADAARQRAQRR